MTSVEGVRAAHPDPLPTERPFARRRHASGAQRLFFAIALITVGIASLYTATALLTRVYPAIFPGQTLSSLLPLGDLPAIVGISAPGQNSVFNRRINLLIMGIDQRPDGVALEPANTDSIMVASIDPLSKQMSLVSIPRDLWVDQTFPDGTRTEDR